MFTSKRARVCARPQEKRGKSQLLISVSRNTSKVLGVEVSVGPRGLLYMWQEPLGVVVPIELDPAGHAFRKLLEAWVRKDRRSGRADHGCLGVE